MMDVTQTVFGDLETDRSVAFAQRECPHRGVVHVDVVVWYDMEPITLCLQLPLAEELEQEAKESGLRSHRRLNVGIHVCSITCRGREGWIIAHDKLLQCSS